MLVLIVAVAENGVIGRDGDLPWRLPADLARFRETTMGRSILMGRRTWESIRKPLPGRRSVVVSRSLPSAPPGTALARSLDEAIVLASDPHAVPLAPGGDPVLLDARRSEPDAPIFVIGGAALYAEALPRADRLELTRVRAEVPGDVAFPAWDRDGWRRVALAAHPADDRHAHPFDFESWERSGER